MKRLYYLRHGLSHMNKLGVYAGHTDTPLAEEGKQGALEEGKKHKDLQIDIILASPLSRAHETAKLFAQGAGLPESMIQTDELLFERNFGVLENTPWSPEVSKGLVNDNLPEGVERWDDMIARAHKILEQIEHLPVDNVLLVAHGSIGRAIRSILNPEADINAHIPNTELVRWI